MFEQDKLIPWVKSANWLQHVKPRTSSSFVSMKKRVSWCLPRSAAETHAIRAIWIVSVNGGGNFLLAPAPPLSGDDSFRPDHQVDIHPAPHRPGRTALGHQEATEQNRTGERVHPRGCGRKSKWSGIRRKVRTGDRRRLQPIDQKFIICRNYINLTRKFAIAKTEEERKRLLNIIEKAYPFCSASSVFPQNVAVKQTMTTR